MERRHCHVAVRCRWLDRGGWSSDLPLRWGKAAGFPSVADSTFNRLQHGRIEQPYPVTFIQFGMINDRLARQDYGLSADDPLVPRLARQRPIEHDDGTPWSAVDFFAHFIGALEAPSWAQQQPLPSLQEAVEASASAAERFKAIAAEQALPLPRAWESFIASNPGQAPALLSRAELEVLRHVLSGWHLWTQEQLRDLINPEGKLRPSLALEAWAQSLASVDQAVPAGT
jgi:hypothetical protein